MRSETSEMLGGVLLRVGRIIALQHVVHRLKRAQQLRREGPLHFLPVGIGPRSRVQSPLVAPRGDQRATGQDGTAARCSSRSAEQRGCRFGSDRARTKSSPY